jgi:hypothetical protein
MSAEMFQSILTGIISIGMFLGYWFFHRSATLSALKKYNIWKKNLKNTNEK